MPRVPTVGRVMPDRLGAVVWVVACGVVVWFILTVMLTTPGE
jgi:hypothetical protein